ncbi:AQJ64_40280 family protein [Streptomyces sp. NPDC102365]|uniref:AQJ64_40280 family protein n=1 Tax=Streptomyces sp. NPDC102365 TaxID=3366162 RepID=UPI00380ED4B2
MNTTIEWIRADERLPYDGAGIIAAVTGRYPGEVEDDPDSPFGKEFWLVLPMYFRSLHPLEESEEVIENCFYDSDGVVRFPINGPSSEEVVTHWAEMPNLPGTDVERILGGGVGPAIRAVFDDADEGGDDELGGGGEQPQSVGLPSAGFAG